MNTMNLIFIVLLLSQTSALDHTMETAHTMSGVFHGDNGMVSDVNALQDIHGITTITIAKVIFCSHLIVYTCMSDCPMSS